jgi:hypothetical protein
LALDPEMCAVVFTVSTISALGLPAIGVGETLDDALGHLRGALRTTARLAPRGRG